ncbi:MAG: DEAD/DEAH box helicase [Candidatus Thiodiazotropha weberae]|nr:DEAD/DEAH box helicase [Candidatus Thiodiazotropha lotti]MCG8011164.1 DEAD/DEAH box helicase [Candidatus Thiodiazotropha lotti]MCW4210626.1 DEAD/DEAH box helicase [Candidatus Thiodiazotropha lotti]MCW4216651.1 DEAD/DEAH box helicase [Candidatus Thiodiazotropha lotti]
MKPENNSRRLYGIARSKGKMYEFGLPEQNHIAIPQDQSPEELLILTVGTLGDSAAQVLDALVGNQEELDGDIRFSASFFDALFSSRLANQIDRYLLLLASAAYLLEGRPGSSLVMARMLEENDEDSSLLIVLRWLLLGDWSHYYTDLAGTFGPTLCALSKTVASHFVDGSGTDELEALSTRLRTEIYRGGDDEEVLLGDLICAIAIKRIRASAWSNLPGYSQLTPDLWAAAIRRDGFPKELWPSQLRLGQAGLFAGQSGIVQMPTSAGKTRAVEIIIRSAFLSGRTNTAVVIAPFRALCHEIKHSLVASFSGEDVRVTELSDSFQTDYLADFVELFGVNIERPPSIVVMTPEKFLYALRQDDSVVEGVGLVVYDEGHQFDSGYRGVGYELLLTDIKRRLGAEAQTVLISAVVQNASEIGEWLIGEQARIVEGSGLLPTARATAFASWVEQRGQVMFFEDEVTNQRDYFVPRVLEQQQLNLFGNETAERVFPKKEENKDVALYLGLRLMPKGPVAVFCGTKAIAEGVVRRALEIYRRGFNLTPPVDISDLPEVEKLGRLFSLHFGEESEQFKAASLGVFAHHGNTPNGLRLCIEYAMQKSLIRFVACTSTLAQGVNLPIRYLVVSGVYQGPERIKVRDFHNLMGRAGRSGIHTEGLVIFADPKIYDKRMSANNAERRRFETAKELIDPSNSEPTSSSLLSLVKPFRNRFGDPVPVPVEQLINLALSDDAQIEQWVSYIMQAFQAYGPDEDSVRNQLKARRNLIRAIESYLMSNRTELPYDEFQQHLADLVQETLAFSLGADAERGALTQLFLAVSSRVEGQIPDINRQVAFGKTLLGAKQALVIEGWVEANRNGLLGLDSNQAILNAVWDVLTANLENKFAITTLPQDLPRTIAHQWIEGLSYRDILDHVAEVEGTKPWGQGRQRLSESDVIGFCEGGLGFDYPLGVAAISQFLFTEEQLQAEESEPYRLFQKALKYGVPNLLAVSTYEFGIADRVLATNLSNLLTQNGYQGDYFVGALEDFPQLVDGYLTNYPSYFSSVIEADR